MFYVLTVMMKTRTSDEFTQLLVAWSDGDRDALEKLVPLIEAELRRLARLYLSSDHTLQTSALVNEAYVRLIGWSNARWENHAHFFGVSAQIMRNALLDT